MCNRIFRISIEGLQKSNNAKALFAPATRFHPISVFVGGVAAHLMLLQFGIPFYQNFFNKHFGQGPQDGKLADTPSFAMKIAAQVIIEIPALIKEAVIVGNAVK